MTSERGPASAVATAEPVRVLLCDDHALYRRGLMMALEEQAGIEVVAEAENGAEAVAMAEDFAPDVVLMDVAMPGLDGVEATRRISLFHPSARIIMLTVSGDSDELFAAIRVGATTYLHKEDSIEVVGDAVRAVVAGQTLLTPELARRLIDEFDRLAGPGAGSGGGGGEATPPPALAPRERAALELVAEGLDSGAVAVRLDVSENTVKNHLRNVIGKLHVHARLAAAGGAADAAPRP